MKWSELTPRQRNMRYLLLVAVNFLLLFVLYKSLLIAAEQTDDPFWAFVVMVVYSAALLSFVLGYLIYNRFLYRKGVTPEQLPEEWSSERREAFIADGERRLARSKWMMTVILPLVLVFLVDAVDIFILDTLR